MSEIRAAITAVHAWVPDYVLTNAELEAMVDTTDEWIVSRTGIRERRILKGEGQGTSVMAIHAVRGLCEKRGIDPQELDAIICATISPDTLFPSTANRICGGIGAGNVLSFDILAACSGFLYALETGSNFIRSGKYKKVVVVGADKMSSITDYTDRNSCILFGDAAAAVLLEPDASGMGIRDVQLHTDATGLGLIELKAGGSAYPATAETVARGEHYFYQDGRSVFRHAVTRMAEITGQLLERNQLRGQDIAWMVPHQANLRIIESTAARAGVSMDRVTINIDRYGNTTAATIPLCLWEWEPKFRRGDNLLLAAFGGGFTWGAAWLKWAY